MPPRVAQALGSGFIIDPKGLIVTNNHVVDGADTIRVTLDDGRDFDATLVGRDPKTDLAVLRIDAGDPLPSLTWGATSEVEAGDRVIAMGNPFGIGTTATAGIVSALGRDLHSGPYDDFLQIDAALNHGNSGGPLLDTQGRVIGVDSAIFSPNDGNVGVGFAIPATLAQKIVSEIEQTGSVERGYLGVEIQPVNADMADAMGLNSAQGAIVAAVMPDTPADKAGLTVGDVILSLNGEDVPTAKALSGRVADLAAGEIQHLSVWRDGKTIDLPVTLKAMPDEVAQAAGPGSGAGEDGAKVPDMGFSASALTPELRQQLGLGADETGVVVTAVDPAASDLDLRPGDVILSVNSQDVTSVDQLDSAVKKAQETGRDAALMLVLRQGSRAFVAVPFAQG